MPGRGEKEQAPAKGRPGRDERAERMLDAALELLQRWGYKKTTLDDIAKHAGVAKGTVYLRWKTREALFETLLLREWLSVFADLRQRLAQDPTGIMLSSLTRHLVSIAVSNPLFRGILLHDTQMLGDLLRSDTGQNLMRFRLRISRTYLELLRDRGLLRTDIAIEAQIKMMAAIATGFFIADQFLPPGYRLTPEELADGLAETLHRTFEPAEPPTPAILNEAMQVVNRLLGEFADGVERKYHESKP